MKLIGEILTSESRLYKKLEDIFEQWSADYFKNIEEINLFYKMLQNKMHFAITGKTAAEIV